MTKTKNRETSEKILKTALMLWGEKGYNQSTMRELARRLGMGVSSLYFYFPSKEAIVQYFYRQVNEQARTQFFAEPWKTRGLADNFSRFLEIKLQLLGPHRSCLVAILKEALDPESSLSPTSQDSSGVLADSMSFFRDLLKNSRVDKKQEARASILWLLHIGILTYWLHDRSTESANTYKLIKKLAKATKLFPVLRTLPGSQALLELLSAVIKPSEKPAALEAPALEQQLRECDVVVIGGGPIGLLFASFLKLRRPRTSILVLESSPEPTHKIGESTLSGFCKALRTVGIRQEVLERMFYPKNGLGFFHIEESIRDLTQAPEYILETFDETFQVERRVLDGLLLANARRLGIQVLQGAQVSIEKKQISAEGSIIDYRVASQNFRVKTSLLVDASGPTSVLSRIFGGRVSEEVAFQSSSVWTYFSGVKPLAQYQGWQRHAQFPRDQYTVHLCFREGWLWYIPLYSWQAAPTANLNQIYERLFQSARSLPSREELAENYACPTQEIVSFGLSLREDRDPRIQEDARAAFEFYAKKYPAIQQVLERAQPLQDYYGPNTSTMSRLRYRGRAKQLAGEGWLLVGDAAFFVDPLISPGLTGGTASAYQAALAAAQALDKNNFTTSQWKDYQDFVLNLYTALERDNELVYMSFNHPEAMSFIQRFQEVDARKHFNENMEHQDYALEDTNVWGILDPDYQKLQKDAWAICQEEEAAVGKELSVQEQSFRDYTRLVKRLKDLLGPYVEEYQELTPYVGQNRKIA